MKINPKTEDYQTCPNCESSFFYSGSSTVGLFGTKEERGTAVPDINGGSWNLMVFQCIECGYVAFFNDALVNPVDPK
jgi:predicted nucleic-acid-binding Zn-ribbon protein